MRDYFVKSGDEYLCWVEAGTEPVDAAVRLIAAYAVEGDEVVWIEVDGHRWAWAGSQSFGSRFTWAEARDIVWNKLKTLNHDGLGNPTTPPRTDRWRYKLARIVPKGDTVRPRRDA